MRAGAPMQVPATRDPDVAAPMVRPVAVAAIAFAAKRSSGAGDAGARLSANAIVGLPSQGRRDNREGEPAAKRAL
jgi:hypothetical protein